MRFLTVLEARTPKPRRQQGHASSTEPRGADGLERRLAPTTLSQLQLPLLHLCLGGHAAEPPHPGQGRKKCRQLNREVPSRVKWNLRGRRNLTEMSGGEETHILELISTIHDNRSSFSARSLLGPARFRVVPAVLDTAANGFRLLTRLGGANPKDCRGRGSASAGESTGSTWPCRCDQHPKSSWHIATAQTMSAQEQASE
ncbi:uncharacterized protein LOC134761729 [Pongo abelii]|uniref:uncharacterized protein LOC134761729 n=1 Tax=Pongo abelii TaxID=9601 RepID=UPI003003C835